MAENLPEIFERFRRDCPAIAEGYRKLSGPIDEAGPLARTLEDRG